MTVFKAAFSVLAQIMTEKTFLGTINVNKAVSLELTAGDASVSDSEWYQRSIVVWQVKTVGPLGNSDYRAVVFNIHSSIELPEKSSTVVFNFKKASFTKMRLVEIERTCQKGQIFSAYLEIISSHNIRNLTRTYTTDKKR